MQTPPFNEYLGVKIVRESAGVAEATLDLGAHHLNLRGVAHGGVVTGLLDSVLGAAVISAIPDDWWCATTSISTQFVDGAGAGRLIGSGRVTRFGRHLAFASGEVRDSENRIIATAQGTWHLWPQRPDKPRTASSGAVRMRDGTQSIRVGKILAVGRNYAAHKREMGTAPDEPPVEFLKPATALVPGGGLLRIPTNRRWSSSSRPPLSSRVEVCCAFRRPPVRCITKWNWWWSSAKPVGRFLRSARWSMCSATPSDWT